MGRSRFSSGFALPGLDDDDGFVKRNLAGRGEKTAGVADRLHIYKDAGGVRVIPKVVNQVAPAYVQHGADRNKSAEPDVFPPAPVKNGSAQRAALAQKGDVARK